MKEGNLIYSQRSVIMRGSKGKISFKIHSATLQCLPTRGKRLKNMSFSQGAGCREIYCIFHPSCLSLSKGTVMGQQQTHSESRVRMPVHLREWMYGLGSQPSLWLRLSCPETGPKGSKDAKEGADSWSIDEVLSYSGGIKSQHPQIRWLKKNVIKSTLLKSTVRYRKAIRVVLCPGVCSSRAITPPGLKAREGMENLETEQLSWEEQWRSVKGHGNSTQGC